MENATKKMNLSQHSKLILPELKHHNHSVMLSCCEEPAENTNHRKFCEVKSWLQKYRNFKKGIKLDFILENEADEVCSKTFSRKIHVPITKQILQPFSKSHNVCPFYM